MRAVFQTQIARLPFRLPARCYRDVEQNYFCEPLLHRIGNFKFFEHA